MNLRPYQSDAIASVYEHLRTRDDNPCVVIPTGGGKTPVIATICRDAVTRWGGRVVILAHVRELLEQAADKIRTIAPDVPLGIYSAGLGRKDVGYAVTIAGIQSVYSKAATLGPADLIIVDEAHMIPPDGEGMYRTFIDAAKKLRLHARVIGLTATPYRLKSGSICGPDQILNHVCYEVGVRDLIEQGYLSPLRSRAGTASADTAGLHVRAGEFVAGEAEDLMDTGDLVASACADIAFHSQDRVATLIFAAGIRHGQHIVDVLKAKHGIECGFVSGETPDGVRAAILGRFRSGELKYLCNVNVLTTGFDAPHIDCVALVRPTMSPGLYYQMVGRGFRLHPGKADCLVLDFGGNVMRHGPVDAIRVEVDDHEGKGDAPAKECPGCLCLVATAVMTCPHCGHEFPAKEKPKHEATASAAGVLSGQKHTETVSIESVSYAVHYKKSDPSAPLTMRVSYMAGVDRRYQSFHEWVCFDHIGYARKKAEAWWRARSAQPVPDGTEEAVEWARAGALAEPTEITVEHTAGSPYPQVIRHKLGPIPPRLESMDGLPAVAASNENTYSQNRFGIPDDEIPF